MNLYYKTYLLCLIVLFSSSLAYEGRDIEVYTTLTTGHFSNAKTISKLREKGIVTAQNLIEVYMFPINYPALKSEIVIFVNELQDGNVIRQAYSALNESGPVIKILMYNVKRSKLFSQALPDVSDLESLSRDDLQISSVCQSFATRIGETLFNAEYPNCNIDGFNSETYKGTHTCDTFTFYVDSDKFPESKSKLPYVLDKDERLPIPASILPDYDKYKAMCGY